MKPVENILTVNQADNMQYPDTMPPMITAPQNLLPSPKNI